MYYIPSGNLDEHNNENSSQNVSNQSKNGSIGNKQIHDCVKQGDKRNVDDNHLDKEAHINVTNKVEIIGDSLLNDLIDDKLSRNNSIKTRKYSGCTTNDLKHHVMPTIDKRPKIIICHAGANDITNNVDTIYNYQVIINHVKKKTSYTKIAISSIITRKDHKDIDFKISEMNIKLKELCEQNLIDFIDNSNIDESCLGERKLHLGKKGNAYLATNFIKYVKSKSQLNS